MFCNYKCRFKPSIEHGLTRTTCFTNYNAPEGKIHLNSLYRYCPSLCTIRIPNDGSHKNKEFVWYSSNRCGSLVKKQFKHVFVLNFLSNEIFKITCSKTIYKVRHFIVKWRTIYCKKYQFVIFILGKKKLKVPVEICNKYFTIRDPVLGFIEIVFVHKINVIVTKQQMNIILYIEVR